MFLSHFYCKKWKKPFLGKTFFSILEIWTQQWPGRYGGWITICLSYLQPKYHVYRANSNKSPHVSTQTLFLGTFQHSVCCIGQISQHLLTKIYLHTDFTLNNSQLKGFVKISISHQNTSFFQKLANSPFWNNCVH